MKSGEKNKTKHMETTFPFELYVFMTIRKTKQT